MKHMHTDKYTIAWFKIAECVSRGEKERALGVYRLLSHSFNDDAVARQLEADIYLSCNELDRAIFLYHQAMEAYEKSHRYLEAAAVCEHLIFLMPEDKILQKRALFYYASLSIHVKLLYYSKILMEFYVHTNQLNVLNDMLRECEQKLDPFSCAGVYQQCIVVMHGKNGYSDIILHSIERVIALFSSEIYEDNVQEFFLFLSTLDQELYEYAVDYFRQK